MKLNAYSGRNPNGIPGSTRTPSERGDAGASIVQEAFSFVKRNLSIAQRRVNGRGGKTKTSWTICRIPVLSFVDIVKAGNQPSMRFMMIVIPKGFESAAPDVVPSAEAVRKMMEYNRSLQQAGVLLALDGLFPPSAGARVSYSDGKATVTDGPFAEAKEVIGGYWIIQVRSREEAIEWAKRAPMSSNEIIEVRQIHEIRDYPEDVQQAAAGYETLPNATAAKG